MKWVTSQFNDDRDEATAAQWNYRAKLVPHSTVLGHIYPPLTRDDGSFITFTPSTPPHLMIRRLPGGRGDNLCRKNTRSDTWAVIESEVQDQGRGGNSSQETLASCSDPSPQAQPENLSSPPPYSPSPPGYRGHCLTCSC